MKSEVKGRDKWREEKRREEKRREEKRREEKRREEKRREEKRREEKRREEKRREEKRREEKRREEKRREDFGSSSMTLQSALNEYKTQPLPDLLLGFCECFLQSENKYDIWIKFLFEKVEQLCPLWLTSSPRSNRNQTTAWAPQQALLKGASDRVLKKGVFSQLPSTINTNQQDDLNFCSPVPDGP
ncbi:hypothetical protein TURU_028516 [Turdus rufiventris]|nr:hypothetical protein TURU_028516 [Turdus rufiventris]